MKTCAILAALALTAPGTLLAGHRGICVPRPAVCHPGFFPRAYYAPRAYCAPGPFFSFSYVSTPFVATRYVATTPIYRATSYSRPAAASIEADVQRALQRLGYYRGSIDGDIGPRSRAAIREFQGDTGLAVTGRIDGALLRTLGI